MATKLTFVSVLFVFCLGACASTATNQAKVVPANRCQQQWLGDFDIEEGPGGRIIFRLHGVKNLDGKTLVESTGKRQDYYTYFLLPAYLQGKYIAIFWSSYSKTVMVQWRLMAGCSILVAPEMVKPRECDPAGKCTTSFRSQSGHVRGLPWGPACGKGFKLPEKKNMGPHKPLEIEIQ